MSRGDAPEWYHPGDMVTTIQAADEYELTTSEPIVDVLADRELDAPRDRIEEMVTSAREHLSTRQDGKQPDSEDPRPMEPRYVDAADASYLGERSFATLLGIVLSRYEGSFSSPEPVDDLAVDLFWNRQHTTVAFRTVGRESSPSVQSGDVRDVIDGDTAPASGRSPSCLGIVSRGGFTPGARKLAEEHDVRLIGRDHLARWFADAKLTPEVLGTIAEREDVGREELLDLVSTLPDMPTPVREKDPLDLPAVETLSITTAESSQAEPDPAPAQESDVPHSATAGEKGTLYADPDEDGDSGTFDRIVDELEDDP